MFSGIGGICSAFKQAGFDISWANEIDDKACKTYKLNFPNTNLIEQDVHKIQPDDNFYSDVFYKSFLDNAGLLEENNIFCESIIIVSAKNIVC